MRIISKHPMCRRSVGDGQVIIGFAEQADLPCVSATNDVQTKKKGEGRVAFPFLAAGR